MPQISADFLLVVDGRGRVRTGSGCRHGEDLDRLAAEGEDGTVIAAERGAVGQGWGGGSDCRSGRLRAAGPVEELPGGRERVGCTEVGQKNQLALRAVPDQAAIAGGTGIEDHRRFHSVGLYGIDTVLCGRGGGNQVDQRPAVPRDAVFRHLWKHAIISGWQAETAESQLRAGRGACLVQGEPGAAVRRYLETPNVRVHLDVTGGEIERHHPFVCGRCAGLASRRAPFFLSGEAGGDQEAAIAGKHHGRVLPWRRTFRVMIGGCDRRGWECANGKTLLLCRRQFSHHDFAVAFEGQVGVGEPPSIPGQRARRDGPPAIEVLMGQRPRGRRGLRRLAGVGGKREEREQKTPRQGSKECRGKQDRPWPHALGGWQDCLAIRDCDRSGPMAFESGSGRFFRRPPVSGNDPEARLRPVHSVGRGWPLLCPRYWSRAHASG